MKLKCVEDAKCDAKGFKMCCYVCKRYDECDPNCKCTYMCDKIKSKLKLKENYNGN